MRRQTTVLVNMERKERAISVAGGLVLIVNGLLRVPFTALILLVSGGYMLYRGMTGRCLGYELLDINRAVHVPDVRSQAMQPETPPPGITPEDEVLQASWDSFPASDPPSWTLGRRDSD